MPTEKEIKGESSITMDKKEDKVPITFYLISFFVVVAITLIMLLPESEEKVNIADKIQAVMICGLVYLTLFYVYHTNRLASSSEKITRIQIYENRLEKLYSPLRFRTNFLQIRDETLTEIRKYSYLGTPKLNKILEEYFEKMENANYGNVKGVVMKKDLKHDDPENIDLQKRLIDQIKSDYDQILREYKELIES